MPLTHTRDLFAKALKGKYALGAFNVNNMEFLQARLRLIVVGAGDEGFAYSLASSAEALLEKPIDVEPFLETLQDITGAAPGLSEKGTVAVALLANVRCPIAGKTSSLK